MGEIQFGQGRGEPRLYIGKFEVGDDFAFTFTRRFRRAARTTAVLAFTAISGFRQRKRGFGSPYRDRTPLSQYSRGLVDPSTVPGALAPLALRSTPPNGHRIELPKRPSQRQPQRQDQTVGV